MKLSVILKKGLAAARKNVGPGLVLQSFALTLVLLYYFCAPVRGYLVCIPVIKARLGILFPVLATALFGGLIPVMFMVAQKEIEKQRVLPVLMFQLLLWAFIGLTVDWFYNLQAWMFGDQANVETVVKKVLCDQFGYTVFFAVPFLTVAMHWQDGGFSFRELKARMSGSFWLDDLLPVLIVNWAVWFPTVAIVYSLPLALQFPLFNLVLCFWSLLLAALSTRRDSSACPQVAAIPATGE